MNKALNIKSFEYCLSTNGSKKKHPLIDKKGENFLKIIIYMEIILI